MAGELVPYGRDGRKPCEVVPVVWSLADQRNEGTAALREGYQRGLRLGIERRRQAERFHDLRYIDRQPVRGRRSGVFPHWFLILMLFALPVCSALAALVQLSPVVQLLAIIAPLLLTLVVVAVIAARSPA